MIVYGMEAVASMGGKYWEMWHFAWEDGRFVFKQNYMPKKYAIAIVPISGFLVCVGALASIIEDSFKMLSGTYTQAKDVSPSVGTDH
jgi:TRAP-type mannitol/chloroaromatic compound transport system permease small subunit